MRGSDRNTTDREGICELLNEQFESVFTVDEGDGQDMEKRTDFRCDGANISPLLKRAVNWRRRIID